MEPTTSNNNLLKIVLLLIIGFAIGIGGMFVFVSSDYYKNKLLGTNQSTPDKTNTPGQNTSTADTGERKIIVPKSIATESYYLSINSMVTNLNAIGLLNNDLTVLLNNVKKYNEEKNYEKLFTVVVDAKLLLKEGESYLKTFQASIESLSTANQATKDIPIRSATNKSVAAGREYATALNNYFVSINGLLDGTAPSQAELNDLSKNIDAVKTMGASAVKEMETLIDLINAKVLEISKSLR
ncbi:MAG: hypothetical protein AAB587_02020 [Patescibacteria group bacterium]